MAQSGPARGQVGHHKSRRLDRHLGALQGLDHLARQRGFSCRHPCKQPHDQGQTPAFNMR